MTCLYGLKLLKKTFRIWHDNLECLISHFQDDIAKEQLKHFSRAVITSVKQTHDVVVACCSKPRTKRPRKKDIVSGLPIKPADIMSRLTTSDDAIWFCRNCEQFDEKKENRWICCDKCGATLHLECSGLDYDDEEYFSIEIEELQFKCISCKSKRKKKN